MANPWQEDPRAPVPASPKPDLSRLMHPLLEQNLDKLAEVYLTNPPEERDRAIAELLHELQENAAAAGAAPAAAPGAEKASPVCPACHRQNRAEQRFCGFCGAPLYVDAAPAPEPLQDYPEESGGLLGLSSSPGEPAPLEDDVQFLRDRTFGGIYATEEANPSHWKSWIAAAVILLLAGLGYREWTVMGRPQSISQILRSGEPAAQQNTSSSGPSSPAPPTAQASAPAQPASEASTPPTQTSPAPETLTETDLPGPTEPGSTATPTPEQSADAPEPANPAPSAAAAQAVPEEKPAAARRVKLASDSETNSAAGAQAPANGSQELAFAQRYLNQHETTLAAEWLWKAVSKQNGQAALLLADLYSRGDGVPQSCEQARMLLVAAAKRGTAGAGAQLRTIESTCR